MGWLPPSSGCPRLLCGLKHLHGWMPTALGSTAGLSLPFRERFSSWSLRSAVLVMGFPLVAAVAAAIRSVSAFINAARARRPCRAVLGVLSCAWGAELRHHAALTCSCSKDVSPLRPQRQQPQVCPLGTALLASLIS